MYKHILVFFYENSKNLNGWVYSLGGLRKRSKGSDFSEEKKRRKKKKGVRCMHCAVNQKYHIFTITF